MLTIESDRFKECIKILRGLEPSGGHLYLARALYGLSCLLKRIEKKDEGTKLFEEAKALKERIVKARQSELTDETAPVKLRDFVPWMLW